MPELRCRGWRQEVILRLLENVLELAERPEDLVVYAAHARAARDHESLEGIVRALERMDEEETLVVQSGKPIALMRTGERAPLVLMANGNLVGRFATPEHFYALEAAGLVTWGGLTAGAWQYIGAQGVIQGTYETFAAVAREHFAGDLGGRLVVTAGLGGMGSAQPLAVAAMLGGVLLCAEVDTDKLERRRRDGYVDRATASIDEALSWARAAASERRALSVGVAANAVDLLEQLVRDGLTPDVVTDLTAAHDLRHGYVPAGCSPAEAEGLRQEQPQRLEALGRGSVLRHVRAMLELRRRGAVVFDYGNNIRPQAAEAGFPEALELDVFTQRYLRPLFCRGIGPFRWICASGDPADQAVLDDLCAETFADVPRVTEWIELARRHVPLQGLPARIAWLGHGERGRFACAANDAVRDGRLQGPVAFTRDHMDSGAMTHPYIITEGMKDGSDAVADWPLLDALLVTASGADLVALHSGGGGYAGYSASAGVTVIADGSDAAAVRLARALDVDTALGVLRHADAGYDEAIECAEEFGLGLREEKHDARA
ncbi:MAG TPA: urocanate hydratase [Thermoleophilaceae bacterium]|nr:urocanate hydratase [Thermoleophilaceae bacterium]